MKQALSTLAISVCFFITVGCSSQPKPFTERKIIIASKETVKVPELNLSITNNGCERQWTTEDGKAGGESAYCGLVIQRKDSIIHAGSDFKPIYIGNVEITIDKMNPWGREEDSIPPGGCRVLVRKVEGR